CALRRSAEEKAARSAAPLQPRHRARGSRRRRRCAGELPRVPAPVARSRRRALQRGAPAPTARRRAPGAAPLQRLPPPAAPASHRCGTPIAVAIVLHGGGSNKEGMRKLACPEGDLTSDRCLHRIASGAGIAVVYANGTNAVGGKLIDPNGVRTWNAGGGQNGYICVSGAACTGGVDDMANLRAP